MTFETVELGALCEFVRGVTFSADEAQGFKMDGYVPILRAGNIGDELELSHNLVWVPARRVSDHQYLGIGDIAICMSSGSPAVLGKTAQLKVQFLGAVGAFCGIIRPRKKEQANYIAHWLRSSGFLSWRDSQANGINIQNLRFSHLETIRIPLPSLPDQRRIAALLDKADRLRRLRRYALELSETYLQSVFLEMFGDPEANPMGWAMRALSDIAEINPSLSRHPASENEPVLFVSMSMVDEHYLSLQDGVMRPHHEVAKGFTPFAEGDILFAKITPCMENGKIVIAEPVSTGIGFGSTEFHIVRSGPATNRYWLLAFLRRSRFRDLAKRSFTGTAGQQRVPSSFLSDYALPVPPIELQEKFAAALKSLMRLQNLQHEAWRQAEHLFQTLLHRAFEGEL